MKNKSRKPSTKCLIYISCLLLFSSCVSLDQGKQTGIKKISNLNAFTGIYQNTFIGNDSSAFSSLWNQLNLNEKSDALAYRKARIALTAIDNNKIKVAWLQDNQEQQSVIIHGKLKDNHFVSKHKRTVIPVPLIYGEFKNNQFQISLGTHNELYLDRLQNQWGWVFLFLASNNSTRRFEYKKDE